MFFATSANSVCDFKLFSLSKPAFLNLRVAKVFSGELQGYSWSISLIAKNSKFWKSSQRSLLNYVVASCQPVVDLLLQTLQYYVQLSWKAKFVTWYKEILPCLKIGPVPLLNKMKNSMNVWRDRLYSTFNFSEVSTKDICLSLKNKKPHSYEISFRLLWKLVIFPMNYYKNNFMIFKMISPHVMVFRKWHSFSSGVLCANPTHKYPNWLFEYYFQLQQHPATLRERLFSYCTC